MAWEEDDFGESGERAMIKDSIDDGCFRPNN